jgi:hypothetical protein
VEFWSAETWQRTRVLTNYTHVLYAPDGRSIWLMRDLRTAGLHDVGSFDLHLPLPAGMFPLAQSPDGRHLAVSVDAHRLEVWNLQEIRKQLRELGLDWTDLPSTLP